MTETTQEVKAEVQVDITPLATPVRVTVVVPRAQMQAKFDEYWDSIKDNLPEAVKQKAVKGFRGGVTRARVIKVAGGEERFYAPVVSKIIIEEVAAKKGLEVLNILETGIKETDESFGVQAAINYEPEVSLKQVREIKPGMAFKVHAPIADEDRILKETEARIVQIRQAKAVYDPADHDVAVVGDTVTFSAKYTVDGQKMPDVNEQRIELVDDAGTNFSFYKFLVEMKANEFRKFTFTETPGNNDPSKVYEGELFVLNLKTKRLLTGDDLAVDAGYETYVQMFNQIKREVEERVTKNIEDQVTNVIVRELMTWVNITPVPEHWSANKAEEMLASQSRQYGGEAKLLKLMNVGRDQVLGFHATNVTTQLQMSLALRWLGRKIEVDGDTSLNHTYDYAEKVRRHLLNTMDVVASETVEVLGFFPKEAVNAD